MVREEPFASEAIRDIIRQHWFGRGKADTLAYNHFGRTQTIPGATIVLVATIVSIWLFLAQKLGLNSVYLRSWDTVLGNGLTDGLRRCSSLTINIPLCEYMWTFA